MIKKVLLFAIVIIGALLFNLIVTWATIWNMIECKNYEFSYNTETSIKAFQIMIMLAWRSFSTMSVLIPMGSVFFGFCFIKDYAFQKIFRK